jgi:hypothetical protein
MAGPRRHSFRRPFPYATLGDALAAFATAGPLPLADSLVTAAIALQPGWSRLRALRASTALRGHRCEAAFDEFVELLEFGIDRPDWPGLVDNCRQERLAVRERSSS